MHPICGLCAPILKVCSTPPEARPQKFFALILPENPPRFLTLPIFPRKPSLSTRRAIFMWALRLTERFIAFHPPAKSLLFFDPKTKYIWDLAFSSDGTLYVATGDKGQIFAVNSSGKGELFYSSDEAHIRVLAFDPSGNLIAGTEPNGRVLRVSHANAKTPPPNKLNHRTNHSPQHKVSSFTKPPNAKSPLWQ